MQQACEKYLKHLRVAVIDDSRAFGAGLQNLIAPYVTLVDVYQNGRDALESFLVTPPDIVITDLEMPDFSGYEMVKALRANPSFESIPILVLTGKEDNSTMAQVIVDGCDAFVAKSNLKESLIVHLLALARLKDIYKKASDGKQLEAVKALIGTYKHEFGNAIAAIDGKLRRIKKDNPEISNDESYLAIQKWTLRLIETLEKLDKLRSYEEQVYVGRTQMLKTG